MSAAERKAAEEARRKRELADQSYLLALRKAEKQVIPILESFFIHCFFLKKIAGDVISVDDQLGIFLFINSVFSSFVQKRMTWSLRLLLHRLGDLRKSGRHIYKKYDIQADFSPRLMKEIQIKS